MVQQQYDGIGIALIFDKVYQQNKMLSEGSQDTSACSILGNSFHAFSTHTKKNRTISLNQNCTKIRKIKKPLLKSHQS